MTSTKIYTMRKILFVTFANQSAYSGGEQCAKRNLKAIEDIYGQENVTAYIIRPDNAERKIRDKLVRMAEIMKCYMGGLRKSVLNDIIHIVKEQQITDLFIDSSQLGYLAKKIKQIAPKTKVYVFFQNIEYDFFSSTTLHSYDYLHLFWIPLSFQNEKWACRWADKVVVLNHKDSHRLEKLYHRQANAIIPITMVDDYAPTMEAMKAPTSRPLSAVFVGSYFTGNVKGLKWFCQTVVPCVDLRLTIVGAGMDKLANDIAPSDKISIHGTVRDLAPYYEEADVALIPITSGGGMKVKTAEALKYGKHIIGTRNALEGYEGDSEIITECNMADEFVQAIEKYRNPWKFQPKARQLFLEKYAYEASLLLFHQLFQS